MGTLTYLTAFWELDIKTDENYHDSCKCCQAGKGVDLRKVNQSRDPGVGDETQKECSN